MRERTGVSRACVPPGGVEYNRNTLSAVKKIFRNVEYPTRSTSSLSLKIKTNSFCKQELIGYGSVAVSVAVSVARSVAVDNRAIIYGSNVAIKDCGVSCRRG